MQEDDRGARHTLLLLFVLLRSLSSSSSRCFASFLLLFLDLFGWGSGRPKGVKEFGIHEASLAGVGDGGGDWITRALGAADDLGRGEGFASRTR